MTTFGINAFGVSNGRDRFTSMVDLAREAESIGCDAVWISELYSRSATVPMAALALGTDTVRIGSNIAYGVGRSPLIWAAEARDLDELSGGRVILGLGNGTPRMMESWHGVSGESPAVRMAELVSVLKKLWHLHEGPVQHEGRFYRLDISPTSDVPQPVRPAIPIWIAGVNKFMLRTAGRSADGLIGHPMFTADYIRGPVADEIAAGAGKADRDPAEISIMGIKMCAVHDNVEVARRQAAFAIGQYAASRVYDRLFELHGWTEDQLRIRDAARNRDAYGLVAAVTDEMIDSIAITCRPEDLAGELPRIDYVDHLDLIAPPWGLTDRETAATNVAILAALRVHLRSPN